MSKLKGKKRRDLPALERHWVTNQGSRLPGVSPFVPPNSTAAAYPDFRSFHRIRLRALGPLGYQVEFQAPLLLSGGREWRRSHLLLVKVTPPSVPRKKNKNEACRVIPS